MNGDDLLLALTPVVEVLERIGVRYHLGGSLASSVHGVARATLDVDVVADLSTEHATSLTRDLRNAYYLDEDAMRRAIAQRSAFNLVHLSTMIKIDVFPAGREPFDRVELDRAREEPLEDAEGARRFAVKSPEDVILRKLLWYRQGGQVSERQWRDVIGVLKVQAPTLDRDYLAEWAERLELTGLLQRAIEEAELDR